MATNFIGVKSTEVNVSVSGSAVFSIQNTTGRTVLSGTLDEAHQKIAIGALPAGLYLIRLQVGNNAPEFHKLVKE